MTDESKNIPLSLTEKEFTAVSTVVLAVMLKAFPALFVKEGTTQVQSQLQQAITAIGAGIAVAKLTDKEAEDMAEKFAVAAKQLYAQLGTTIEQARADLDKAVEELGFTFEIVDPSKEVAQAAEIAEHEVVKSKLN